MTSAFSASLILSVEFFPQAVSRLCVFPIGVSDVFFFAHVGKDSVWSLWHLCTSEHAFEVCFRSAPVTKRMLVLV